MQSSRTQIQQGLYRSPIILLLEIIFSRTDLAYTHLLRPAKIHINARPDVTPGLTTLTEILLSAGIVLIILNYRCYLTRRLPGNQ